MKTDIKSLTLPALQQQLAEMGEPPFRAGQVWRWLHQRGAVGFADMTDLSAGLRETLGEKYYINSLKIKKKLVSDRDGTVKYLYELRDGNCIEAVRLSHRHGASLCISTQIGCRMGCTFCASTIGRLVRNLDASEMIDQIYTAEKDTGRVDSVVLMGIGEPLDNYDNVCRFLQILSHKDGRNMSLRHLSLSTCGLVEEIDRLAQEKLGLTLSVSLHAPDDETRSAMMPINRKWPIDPLLAACKRYFDSTGRRISFEYTLVRDCNDSAATAQALADRLKGMNCHVNLIPLNPVPDRPSARSDAGVMRRFQQVLEANGITATFRREQGGDIAAACGQLRRAAAETTETPTDGG